MNKFASIFVGVAGLAALSGASIIGEYTFNNNLHSTHAGDVDLTTVGSITSPYGTASIYGGTRTTYTTNGVGGNNQGLAFDGSTTLAATYSVELVVNYVKTSGWRKLVDTSNRAQDRGWYIDPNSKLDLYSGLAGGTTTSAGDWNYIVVTNDGGGNVAGYLNGVQEFNGVGNTQGALDSSKVISLFVDDFATSTNEYTPVSTALVRIHNSALSAGQVQQLAVNPFASVTPEPASVCALALGAVAMLRRRKK